MIGHQRVVDAFVECHDRPPQGVWSAPGRVNLIGEHTDYNDGFVLPFALPYRTWVAGSWRTDGLLSVATVGEGGQLQRTEAIRLDELTPNRVRSWAAYPCGVAWALRKNGIELRGADIVIYGSVPAGAGLSSSHALECATALTLLGLEGIAVTEDSSPNLRELARWVQQTENDFVGAPTGLLDQTASLCCVAGHVLFLDVRSGHSEQVVFDLAQHGLEVLVIDTRVKHSHAASEYGARRRGCEQAAALLGVPALRDIDLAKLSEALKQLPEDLASLVRHVVTENQRVLDTVKTLRESQFDQTGPLLTASHHSLRDDYRVSCPELDLAVQVALDTGALGARMTGGGFGGSAIALISSTRRNAVEQAVTAAFARKSLTLPRMFTAVPSAGAGRDE